MRYGHPFPSLSKPKDQFPLFQVQKERKINFHFQQFTIIHAITQKNLKEKKADGWSAGGPTHCTRGRPTPLNLLVLRFNYRRHARTGTHAVPKFLIQSYYTHIRHFYAIFLSFPQIHCPRFPIKLHQIKSKGQSPILMSNN